MTQTPFDWKKHNAASRKIRADILRDARKKSRLYAKDLKKMSDEIVNRIIKGQIYA